MGCFDCVHCKVCTLHKRYNEPCDYYEERKKKGKWIHYEQVTGLGGYWKCSSCGEPAIFTPRLDINNVQIYSWDNNKTNYCSNCGADMRGDT